MLVGAPPQQARAAVVLVHGRDQDESVMLDVVDRLGVDQVAYLLPLAPGKSWYDGRYFEPVAALQPKLDRALTTIRDASMHLHLAGVPRERIVLAGFSQGGCLVAESVARSGGPLRGAAVLAGSLIGEPDARTVPRSVPGLPMYFACGREDPWLTLDEARATADAFSNAGAEVHFDVPDEPDHVISDVAVNALRGLLGD